MSESTDPALELTDVCVRLPGVRILEGVSWRLPVGAKAAILGPNGCGKSTLLRAITAYGHFTCGTVRVLGETIGETNVHQLRSRLGIVDPTLSRRLDRRVTAEQLVATGLRGHLSSFFDQPNEQERQRAGAALRAVGLADHSGQTVNTLSSGQLSRVWLARALVNEPELLILDEPATDLDLLGRETFLSTLAQLTRDRPSLTTVTVTHHLEDLHPDTGDVLLLARGAVVAAGPPQVVLTSAQVSRAFGWPVEVERRQGRWQWTLGQR